MPEKVVGPDNRLQIAYNAAESTLRVQDTTLGNLRTRANTLLAAAALFTTFSTGIGLFHTDPRTGLVLSPAKAVLLIAVVAVLGLCVFFVEWPAKGWCFSPSAEKIMELDRSSSEADIREYVVAAMITGINSNARKLKHKQRAFEFAASLLVVEVALLVVFVSVWQ